MHIFIFITFIIAILCCIGSTIWVIFLGLKRRRLNRPYHIREYQEFVKKEKPTGAKLSLSQKFKNNNNPSETKTTTIKKPKEVVIKNDKK